MTEYVSVETGSSNGVGLVEGVAVIRLDRTPVNALGEELQRQLIEAAAAVNADRSIRTVVLSGGPTMFAAGGDIKELSVRDQTTILLEGARMSATIRAVADIGKPVIAAVEGYALGGGMELALAADFRVCSESARWGQPEVLLGLMPAGGGTQRLPRLIGAARAKDLLFTGRVIGGSEALAVGLVQEVTADGQALAAAADRAAGFVELPPLALRAIKLAIDQGLDSSLDSGLRTEVQLLQALYATEDARAGIESFILNGPGRATFAGR